VNRNPLGACAITTTGFPIDRSYTEELLGFDGLQINSYGAIAAVDYVAESCTVLATVMLSLGRFTQDLLLWSTVEFGYLRLSDAYVQISSIMPQKRNPVPLEHVRVLASRALFEANSVLGALHNTPFADMNDAEDDLQPLVYLAFEDGNRSLRLLAGALSEAEFHIERMAAAADSNFLPVTELADTLVRRTGISFHSAHGIVSRAVRKLTTGYDAEAMTEIVLEDLALLGKAGTITRNELRAALSAANFVAVRKIVGGPAPEALDPQIVQGQRQLQADREWLSNKQQRLTAARAMLRDRCNAAAGSIDGD
jgi:argininosuccinate lyase